MRDVTDGPLTIEEPAPSTAAASRGVRLSKAVGMHDGGRALRDFMTYLPAQFLPAVAGALALLLLPRRMQPTPYGVLQIALGVTAAGWIIVSQWLTGSVTRELPAARVRGDLASFSVTFARALKVVLLIFGLYAVAVAVLGEFSSAVGDNLLLILLATAGLIAQNIAITLYAALLRPRTYAVVLLLSRIGGIGVGIWLVYQGEGVTGYLAALAVASGLVGLVALAIGFPRAHGVAPKERSTVREWASYGIPAGLSSFVVWGMLFVDRFLIGALRSVGETGVYALGATIGSQVVTIPAVAFMTGARPLAIKAYAEKGRGEVERLMTSWTRIVLLIVLPTAAFVTVTAQPLLRFGPGAQKGTVFYPALQVVPVVALGTGIFVLAGIGNLGLTVSKQMRRLILASVLGLTANVLANLVLIPKYGIVGAAISTPIASAVYLGVAQQQARRYASWNFPWRTLVRGGIAAGVASLVGWAAIQLFPHPLDQAAAGEAIALAAVGGGLAYVGALALLGELRSGA